MGCEKYHSNHLYLWVKPETEFLSQWKLICLMQLDHYQCSHLLNQNCGVIHSKSSMSRVAIHQLCGQEMRKTPQTFEFVINLSVFCHSVSQWESIQSVSFLTFELSQKFDQHLWNSFLRLFAEMTVCFFFFFVRMCWLVNPRRIPSTMSFWQLANFFCKLSQQNKKSDMLTRQKGFLLLFLACLCSFSQQNVRENKWVFLEICQTFNNKFVLFFLLFHQQRKKSQTTIEQSKKNNHDNTFKKTKRIENKNNDSNHNNVFQFLLLFQ